MKEDDIRSRGGKREKEQTSFRKIPIVKYPLISSFYIGTCSLLRGEIQCQRRKKFARVITTLLDNVCA
jgi:hypothetical protein